MSVTKYANEPDERLWDYYLQDCRANNVHPDLSSFAVWAEDQDIDLDPEEPAEREFPDVE